MKLWSFGKNFNYLPCDELGPEKLLIDSVVHTVKSVIDRKEKLVLPNLSQQSPPQTDIHLAVYKIVQQAVTNIPESHLSLGTAIQRNNSQIQE